MNLNLTPAHLHLMLNHIPIIGIMMASFTLFIGILAQSRTTIATGLLATLLCAAAMPTIMETGSKASHAFREGTLLPPLDDAGKAALHLHGNRADKTTPVIYASALLAVLALLALLKFPQASRWLAAAVLLGNGASILLAIWTADAGGRIRHKELRPSASWDESASSTTAPAATPPSQETASSVVPVVPLENNTPSNSPTVTPVTTTVPAEPESETKSAPKAETPLKVE